MLQAHSGIITLADVTEVIDEWLERRIVLIIQVHGLLVAERTLLQARVGAVLLLAGLAWRRHIRGEESVVRGKIVFVISSGVEKNETIITYSNPYLK
jgi:hypothetical protein